MRLLLVVALAALLAGLAAFATSAVARGWARPVDGPVARAFSVGADRFAAGQHRGVDLGAPPGSRVLAPCGGRVSFAGRVPRGGRTVSVRCGALIATLQHLGSIAVSRGQVVMPGGRVGTAGRPRPHPHVHLSARVAATGAYRDPLALIAGAGGPPPLPVPALRRAPPHSPGPGSRPRPLPLGRSPARVPRPLALGRAPAPATRRLPAPLRLPGADVVAPAGGPSRVDRLPWPVWLGVALVALGLPLGGGLVALRRRRLTRSRPALTPSWTRFPG